MGCSTYVSNEVDLAALERDANVSELGESFLLVNKGEGHRIGLLARRSHDEGVTFSVELVVRLLKDPKDLKMEDLENHMMFNKTLLRMGYSISQQEDGWFLCTREVGKMEALEEIGLLARWINGK